MAERSMVITGLPSSGKTTFLAALWHLVTSREIPTLLRFESLRHGDASHLNELSRRWRNAEPQIRTELVPDHLVSMVSMNLIDVSGSSVRLTFPDASGEAYRHMWEDRDCARSIADVLTSADGMLLFIHADEIRVPQWVVDVAAQSRMLGLKLPDGQEVPWHPRLAPTQVQVVDLLQLFKLPPIDVGLNRVTILLSAWDKVAAEGRTPEEFLEERLPLLDQYLRSGADRWTSRVYGISAQGGDYEKPNMTIEQRTKLEGLRTLDQPSKRIRLVHKDTESHDITEPVAWLMS